MRLKSFINFLKVVRIMKNWEEFLKLHFETKEEIKVHLRNGLKFTLRGDKKGESQAFIEVFVEKVYNPEGFEINKDDVVVDIGAQAGLFSLYAAEKGARVIGFEPDQDNYVQLSHNVNDSSVILYNSAVSDKNGEVTFYKDERSYTTHTMFKESNKQAKYTEVKDIYSITLADIFTMHNIDRLNFLKIDCEGAEYPILFSTPKKYLQRIDKIAVECHQLNEKYNTAELIKFLQKNGFEMSVEGNMIYARRIK